MDVREQRVNTPPIVGMSGMPSGDAYVKEGGAPPASGHIHSASVDDNLCFAAVRARTIWKRTLCGTTPRPALGAPRRAVTAR